SVVGTILDYEWIVHHGAANYTSTGTATQNQSQYYTFDKAGVYSIELNVYVENSDPNGDPCVLTEIGSIIVPYVAEMQWGLACNLTNNGYVLLLEDFSSVFPTYSITQYQWSVDGSVVGTSSTCTPAATTGATQTIELIVSNGISYPCTTSMQVNVPDLPVADFATQTTYDDPCDPFKSCEGREIEFTNNSTPMSNIIFNEWDFDDNTYSHMVGPIKTFDINSLYYNFNVELKVTDKQGCQNTTTQTITVYNNEMDFSTTPYSPALHDVCHGSNIQDIHYSLLTPGTPTYTHQWYMGTDMLPSYSPYTDEFLSGIQPPESSTYWVRITDANYCFKDINPVPAKVSVKYAPTAIIEGKQDVCANEEFTLKAITGYPASSLDITYSWDCPVYGLPIPDDKIVSFTLAAGVYTFELTVVDLQTTCSFTSGPFTVTVHDLPAKPTIDLSVIECDNYELELTGSSSVIPTPEFNWSNGDCGQSTVIYHGGAYRLWITDEHGCRNYEDIDVPLAPSYYFWRFPLGCYYYCAQDLPKWIDGPANIIFKEWEWLKDGSTVIFNNGNPSSGTNSVCKPLAIDLPHYGDGPGNYNWKLSNSLCTQESGIMVWDTVDCCEVELTLEHIECADNIYNFVLMVDQDICDNPSYNLAVVDHFGLAVAPITNLTPAVLNNGITLIYGSFPLIPGITIITFEIKVNCYPYPCTAKIKDVTLPICTKASMQNPGQGESLEDEKIEKAELDIIPNPAKSQTNIHYSFIETENFITAKREIRIFDTMGRPVKTIEINDTQGLYVLDLNNYSSGIYFVELNSNNQRLLTRRMIIYH
ncbi:MAG: T9SS type A sorting domain-containing protein, partial [Bacteroidales bacterium]|nr:T9SS type A sorting domain-containing protein [Bacteroidales bacterium]